MPRKINTQSRGKQPQMKHKKPQIKLTFGGKIGLKNGVPTISTVNKGTKRRQASYSDSESTSDGDISGLDEDDESEDADDESDDPEALALLPSVSMHSGAGLLSDLDDTDTDLDEWLGFPEVPEASQTTSRPGSSWDDLDSRLFRSDDDYDYEKVNEIGDDDEDTLEAIEASEEAHILTNFDGVTSHFANQIDGMSEYGFGSGDEGVDDDDTNSVLLTWSSGDEAKHTLDRHVRFEDHMGASQHQQVGVTDSFSTFDHSPAMARALLPSALPDKSDEEDDKTASTHDDYDSDATEELDEPAQAWQMSSTVREQGQEPEGSSPTSSRRSPIHKGPIRGTFEDDGDKVTAILDPTGRKLLLQDPHLLGGVFARKYGPSAPASPSNSFTSAVLEDSDDDASITESPAQPHPLDISLAVMNSQHQSTNENFSSDFMLAKSSLLSDFIVADALHEDGKGPDGDLNFEDLISVGSTNEDEEMPLPATHAFPPSSSAPGTPLSHLNHLNVTAFKRRTEQRSFGIGMPFPPMLSQFSMDDPCSSPLRAKHITPLKRKRRVDKHESPYNHSHYDGVTPVQRVAHHEYESSPAPSTSRMHKRRRTLA